MEKTSSLSSSRSSDPHIHGVQTTTSSQGFKTLNTLNVLDEASFSQYYAFLDHHPAAQDPKTKSNPNSFFNYFKTTFLSNNTQELAHLLSFFQGNLNNALFKEFCFQRGYTDLFTGIKQKQVILGDKNIFFLTYLPFILFVFLEKKGDLDDYCLDKICPHPVSSCSQDSPYKTASDVSLLAQNEWDKKVLTLLFLYLKTVAADDIAHIKSCYEQRKRDREFQKQKHQMKYARVPEYALSKYSSLVQDTFVDQEIGPLAPQDHQMYIDQALQKTKKK